MPPRRSQRTPRIRARDPVIRRLFPGGRRPEPDPESESESEAEPSRAERPDAESSADPRRHDAQMVKKLVRYAISCEFSRTVIKRSGIRDVVLGDQNRAFKKIFGAAQEQLRQIFGMEMVELPTRGKETMSLTQRRQAAKTQTKSMARSNNYIVVTTLPEAYRTANIVPPSRIGDPDAEAAYVGVCTFIIALLILHGGTLNDGRLGRYLRRVNAAENMPGGGRTEAMMRKLVKDHYIIKIADKKAADEDGLVTWGVGPRGKVEVGPNAVAGMIRAMYGVYSPNLERRLQTSLHVEPKARPAEGPTRRRREGR